MAFQANARTFTWDDDESEVIAETAEGMLVSNHSYGVPVTGSAGTLPSWFIGSYVEDSRVWDEIAFNAKYYLPIFSAGNDGENQNNPDPIAFGIDIETVFYIRIPRRYKDFSFTPDIIVLG